MTRPLSLITVLLVALSLRLDAQHHAGDAGWTDIADAAAAVQLEEAYRAKDYKRIAELATQLQAAQDRKKKAQASLLTPPVTTVGNDGIKALKNKGWSLKLAPDADEGKPARFAYTKDFEKDTDGAFNAEFYLKWEPAWDPGDIGSDILEPNAYTPMWIPAFSAQGKLSTGDSTTTDALRFRQENLLFLRGARSQGARFDGLIAILSVKEESDRDFDVSRLSAEAWFTFNQYPWHVGSYNETATENKDLPPISWRWRPYIGFDAGGYLAGRHELDDADSALRLMARGTLDFSLNAVRDWLSLKEVILFVDDTYTYLTDTGASFNYLRTGLNFQFNDFVGFGLQYKWGQDAPRFQDEDKFEAAFTVKF